MSESKNAEAQKISESILKNVIGDSAKIEQIILDCFNEGIEKCQLKK